MTNELKAEGTFLDFNSIKPDDTFEVHHKIGLDAATLKPMYKTQTMTFEELCKAVAKYLIKDGIIPGEDD